MDYWDLVQFLPRFGPCPHSIWEEVPLFSRVSQSSWTVRTHLCTYTAHRSPHTQRSTAWSSCPASHTRSPVWKHWIFAPNLQVRKTASQSSPVQQRSTQGKSTKSYLWTQTPWSHLAHKCGLQHAGNFPTGISCFQSIRWRWQTLAKRTLISTDCSLARWVV